MVNQDTSELKEMPLILNAELTVLHKTELLAKEKLNHNKFADNVVF